MYILRFYFASKLLRVYDVNSLFVHPNVSSYGYPPVAMQTSTWHFRTLSWTMLPIQSLLTRSTVYSLSALSWHLKSEVKWHKYFRNIRGTSSSAVAVTLECSKGIPCQNIYLEDVYLGLSSGEKEETETSHLSVSASNIVGHRFRYHVLNGWTVHPIIYLLLH